MLEPRFLSEEGVEPIFGSVEETRAFAVKALTQCAVTAARWRAVLDVSPATVAFPGGSE